MYITYRQVTANVVGTRDLCIHSSHGKFIAVPSQSIFLRLLHYKHEEVKVGTLGVFGRGKRVVGGVLLEGRDRDDGRVSGLAGNENKNNHNTNGDYNNNSNNNNDDKEHYNTTTNNNNYYDHYYKNDDDGHDEDDGDNNSNNGVGEIFYPSSISGNFRKKKNNNNCSLTEIYDALRMWL